VNEEMASTRLAAGEAMLELARQGADIVAISADTSKSMYIDLLKKDFDERCIDTGIAEQNMMMIAAGLASAGKIVFAASYSVFTSMRCCEQLRTFIAYPNLNVKIIAGMGGLTAGTEGVTHMATEDLGIVRCIANFAVMAPSDAVAVKKAVKAAAFYRGPVYIRVGREPSPVLSDDKSDFEIGRSIMHKKGRDITIIAAGLVLYEVFEAAKLLEKQGINAGIIEVHTLKPVLNPELILSEAMSTKNVITVEEHNVTGGLGSVVSEIIAGNGTIKFKKLGLQDTFAESGTFDELLTKYRLKAPCIAEEAIEMIK